MNWSILVVDDEPMTRDLLRLMLKGAGYNILEAENGFEALEKIEAHKPDVVILDVMMPGMDGFAVCRQLRADAETADLPVIMLSAKSNAEAIEEGLAAGANKYLTKPVSHRELIKHLGELLSESQVA